MVEQLINKMNHKASKFNNKLIMMLYQLLIIKMAQIKATDHIQNKSSKDNHPLAVKDKDHQLMPQIIIDPIRHLFQLKIIMELNILSYRVTKFLKDSIKCRMLTFNKIITWINKKIKTRQVVQAIFSSRSLDKEVFNHKE